MSGEGNIFDYKINALTAVKFHLVFSEDDLDSNKENGLFKPEMAHQVFGSGETIFGYKNLSIDLYYLHNSSKCLVDVKYLEKVNNFDADDIIDLLNPWLPAGYVIKTEEFIKIAQNEKHDQIFGSVIHEFERKTEAISLPGKTVTCHYKITQCDPQDPLFQEYHQRFETYIIWFIDAANYIDLSDERWLIFYIYEEYKNPESNEIIITPIGYTAIYKFFSYPSNNRARISQFFILPTHQRKGFGIELYKAVFHKLRNDMQDIIDITVEEPSESFQRLRDICDASYIYEDLQTNNSSIATKSPKVLNNYMAKHKICKRQASRLSDILQYHTAFKSGSEEVKTFSDALLKKMEFQIEKEFGGHKRARGVILQENQDPQFLIAENLKARYTNYYNDIKFVAQKLSNILCQNSN